MSKLNDKQFVKIVDIYGSVPAFREIYYDMTDRIFQWAKKHDQNLFLFYGSLLGFTRENRIIGWDNDVDTGILDSEFNRESLKDLPNFGFEAIEEIPRYHRPANKFCTEIYSIFNAGRKSKFEFIDIDPLKDKDESNVFFRWWYKDYIIPKAYLKDLVNDRWNDKCDVIIPNQPERVLNIIYKDTWWIPKSGRTNVELDKDYAKLIENRLKELNIKNHSDSVNSFFEF